MKLRIWIYMQQYEAFFKGDKERLRQLWKMKEDRPDLYPRLKEWLNGL